MKNSIERKLQKWNNALMPLCRHYQKAFALGILVKSNKKRFLKICKNIDFWDKKVNKILQRKTQ